MIFYSSHFSGIGARNGIAYEVIAKEQWLEDLLNEKI